MIEKFFPDLIVDKVQDIDLEILRQKNIKGLILDIDNTLVPPHVKEADENAVKWIEKVKEAGFKMCIVSNASKKRVIKFNENLKLYAIHWALKPGVRSFKKAVRLMDIMVEETAVVGDQIFTDVQGGNKMGMFTILTRPIHKNEFIFVLLKRLPERFVLAAYEKRNMKKSVKSK